VAVSNSVAGWVITLVAQSQWVAGFQPRQKKVNLELRKARKGPEFSKPPSIRFTAASFISKANGPHSSAVCEILRPVGPPRLCREAS
jgi:hypothetical protein